MSSVMNSVWTCPDSLQPGTAAAMGDGVMYFASQSTGTIRILDLQSGQLLDPPGNSQPPETPWQTPSYANGALYATDDFGNVFSINPKNANVVWRQPLSSWALSCPIADLIGEFDVVYAADAGTVYRVGANGQGPTSVYQTPNAIDPNSPPVLTSPQQLIIAEGNAQPDGGVDGLSALSLSGAAVTRTWAAQCGNPINPPTVAGESIYVCASIGSGFSVLRGLSASDGVVTGTSPQFAGAVQYPVCVQSSGSSTQIYVSTDLGMLYCFDGSQLAPLWSVQPMGAAAGPLITPPVVSNGLVYVGGDNQILYAIPVGGGGAGVVSYDTGSPITCIAGVANGTVYVATAGGIQAINLQSTDSRARPLSSAVSPVLPIAPPPATTGAYTRLGGQGTGNITFNIGDGGMLGAANVTVPINIYLYDDGSMGGNVNWSEYDANGNTIFLIWFLWNAPQQPVNGFTNPGSVGIYLSEQGTPSYWQCGNFMWGLDPPGPVTDPCGAVVWKTVPAGWIGDWEMTCNAGAVPNSAAGGESGAIKLATLTFTLAQNGIVRVNNQ